MPYRRRRYDSASRLAYHFRTFSFLAAVLALVYILLFVTPQFGDSQKDVNRGGLINRLPPREQEAFDLVYTRLLLRQILDEADYFADIEIQHPMQPRMRQCSGSLIERDGAYFVLTVAHIQDAICCPLDRIYVHLQDSVNTEETELLGYDNRLDVAVLKFKNSYFRFNGRVARLGSSTLINEGQAAILLRASAEDRERLGLGEIVSNDFDDFYSRGNLIPRLVYTCPSAPGDSGGPVLNLNGEIIGMHIGCNLKDNNTRLAVPINSIAAVLDELIIGVKR